MTVGALGFQTILNTGKESTFGTGVTTDRSYELLPSESMKRKNIVISRAGMRGGTIAAYPETRRVVTGQTVDGDFTLEVLPISMGRIFEQLLGAAPTITPVGGTAAQTHLYALGPVAGKSLTLQKVFKDPSLTTIQTITQTGCKFTSGEFNIAANQFLTLKLAVDGQKEVSNVSAAASAFVSATVDPYHFQQATLSVNGSAVANVEAATVTVNRKLKVDRRYLGNAGLKDEQTEEARPDIAGSLTYDVINSTLYDLFVLDGGGTLVATFVGGPVTGASGSNNTLTITVDKIHLTGDTPAANSTGLLKVQAPFVSDSGATTITYLTSDTAA